MRDKLTIWSKIWRFVRRGFSFCLFLASLIGIYFYSNNMDSNISAMITFTGHTSEIKSIAYSPDGKRIFTAGQEGLVRKWYALNSEEAKNPRLSIQACRNQEMGCITISPDGHRVVAGCIDGSLKKWDVVKGGDPTMPPVKTRFPITSLSFSPTGSRMLTGHSNGSFNIFDPRGRNTGGGRIVGHNGAVTAICFSPDAQRILTVGSDNTAKEWSTTSGKITKTITIDGSRNDGLSSLMR